MVSIVGAGRVYTVVFIVENPTLNIQNPSFACVGKNKYSINTGVDEVIETRFTYIDQQITFKSNKPDVAYIDERGNLVVRTKGKAKLTTKINGKTITLNVLAEE